MSGTAKRRLTETWREAVLARCAGSERRDACLAAFDAKLADGASEAEAAYRALEAYGLLWPPAPTRRA